MQPVKLRDALRENDRLVRGNKSLATIDREMPCVLELDACRLAAFQPQKFLELFQELEFRSLLTKIPQTIGADTARAGGQLSLFDDERPKADAAAPVPPADGITSDKGLATLGSSLRGAERFFIHPVATQKTPID